MRDGKKFQQAVEETKAGIINRPYNTGRAAESAGARERRS